MDDLYPVTIVSTRYGGTYEGKAWAAFNAGPEQLSHPMQPYYDWDGGDYECQVWWADNGKMPYVAVGNTPNEALKNLINKQKEQ